VFGAISFKCLALFHYQLQINQNNPTDVTSAIALISTLCSYSMDTKYLSVDRLLMVADFSLYSFGAETGFVD
jgi:hypothetical protein